MSNPEITKSSQERLTLPRDINLDQLLQILVLSNVPIDEYGKGVAKSISHLLSEINEGESTLSIDVSGNIFRFVNVLWVDVYCSLSNGEVYVLKEDHQEFKDGRIKIRNLDSSIGEKLKPSEILLNGVRRALHEEIGISDADDIYEIGCEEKTFIPDTFPGIESTYKMHKFVTVIPESSFIPEGYVEYQNDKTNYYCWKMV